MKNKIITKTSKQAEFEKRIKMGDNMCPECGHYAIAGIKEYDTGYFKHKTWTKYICVECGCEWKVE